MNMLGSEDFSIWELVVQQQCGLEQLSPGAVHLRDQYPVGSQVNYQGKILVVHGYEKNLVCLKDSDHTYVKLNMDELNLSSK